MIALRSVSKTYDDGKTYAVRRLDLEVAAGELVVLLGESGCGKTTTLKMINRLVEKSGGVIEVDGTDVDAVDPVGLRRRIGYVFQGIGLFPHLTIAENVAIVPALLGWSDAEKAARVDELLNLMHLDPKRFRDRYPKELSGGQRQRVGLSRALAARPSTMLMDEPFGALDPITRDHLQDEYRRIHNDLGLTTVMVTHDITESLLLADRIAVMSGGEIARIGSPRELMDDPGHRYVAELLETPRKQAGRLGALLGEAMG